MKVVPLGELVKFTGGGTPSRDRPEYWGGSIPWVSCKDLNGSLSLHSAKETITDRGLESSASNLIPPRSLLVATRMSLGKAVINEVPVAINQDLKAAICSPALHVRYLLWFWLSQAAAISRMGSGATVKGVTLSQINELKIPLPSLEEQKRIAAILDKADAIRRKREQAIKLADEFLRSLFLDMFGDPVRNPKGWPVEPLAKLIAAGPQNGLYRPSSDYGSGTPIVRIDSFDRETSFGISSLKRLRISEELQATYGLQQNDLLINRVNSRSHLGKSALVPALSEPVVFESNMMRLKLKEDLLQPFYAMHFLRTSRIKRQIQTLAKDAVNQASINQTDVLSLEFLLPPLSDQFSFAKIASRLDGLLMSAK